MNKQFILTTALFVVASLTIFAQDKKEDEQIKKEREIVIRQKGGDKTTIIIDGDKVTINGKSADEWKGGDVEIYNYKTGPRIRMPKIPRIVAPHGRLRIFEDGEEFSNKGMLGITMKDHDKGAEVTNVHDESAAEKAGLQKGDVITKVGDKKVTDSKSLSEAVKSYKAGEEVNVVFLREGKEKSVKAKLDKSRGGVGLIGVPHVPNFDFDFNFDKSLAPLEGLGVRPFERFGDDLIFNFHDSRKIGIKTQDQEEGDGIKIVDVEENSPAAKAGLKKDDVILEISGDKIKDTNTAREAINENWEKGTLNIKIKRNGSLMDVEVKIPKKIKSANL
ncbi:MAG TPA: PDZ domain-containing protein [Chitinophagaceae bacterium]|nr:PDZ domain-containing protein [Chitinophagaceae bacterium]